jgi:hypothetical protein
MSNHGFNGWHFAAGCATIAGAAVAVARYFLLAKLMGQIMTLRLEADIADALEGNDRMWLVARVVVYNDRARPTGITGWKLALEFADGTIKEISDGPLNESYWDKLTSGQPQKQDFMRFRGVRFEQGTPHEGWVGFPCRPEDYDAIRFTVVAVGSTGKEYALDIYRRAAGAAT